MAEPKPVRIQRRRYPRVPFARLRGGTEIRLPKSVDPKDFDEFIADRASIHMEMMDTGSLWMGVEAGGRRYRFAIYVEKRSLRVLLEDDGPLANARAPKRRATP